MKAKKLVGALALTAALAMGTMPAFAAGAGTPSVSSNNAVFAGGNNSATAETTIKGYVINDQLQATVPLELTVVFNSAGGSDLKAPSASAYGIKNTGSNAIKVTSAVLTPVTSGFNWDNSTKVSDKTTTITEHQVHMELNGETYGTGGEYVADATKWNIAGGSTLPIAITGDVRINGNIGSGDLDAAFAKIAYTIAPA